MRTILVVLAILLILAATLIGQEKPIILKVNPKIVLSGMTGADVKFEIKVARHPDNRLLSFNTATLGPGPIEGRTWQLDGENERVTFPICLDARPTACFTRVSGGEDYIFTACVHRVQEGSNKLKAICASEKVEVR